MSTAVVVESYGGPEVLQVRDVREPHAGPGQVRIRVTAAGLNPVDWKVASSAQAAEALAGDQPTPVDAAAAIAKATGLPVRYQQLTDAEAAAISPEIAEVRKRWQAGDRWHADIEALRVIHPGLRTLADWLAESGAATIRARLAAS